MADDVQSAAHPPLQTFEFESEFDEFPIPSMDFLLEDNRVNSPDHGSGFEFDVGVDLESFLGDPQIFYLPGEDEQFIIPNGDRFIHLGSDRTPRIGNVTNGDRNGSGLESALSIFSAVSGDCKRKDPSPPSTVLMDNGADGTSNDGTKISEDGRCERESSGGTVSSQGSGNCESGMYRVMNVMSPDPGHSGREVLSDRVIDQNLQMENEKDCVPKRSRENDEESNLKNNESRACKYRRSSNSREHSNEQGVDSATNEEEKRKARLMKNRESAQLSRERKKHYVVELEHKVKSMHSTIADLNNKISFIMSENANLRQQLSSSSPFPLPAPGLYTHPPMAHMAYPWVPCASYVMKPQGSVPLVPIPRLKTQTPVSASKKKTKGNTKKVASLSIIGVLLFIILFGGLVPMVGFENDGYDSFESNSQYRGRGLNVHGHINGSKGEKGIGFYDVPDKISRHKDSCYHLTHHELHPAPRSSEFDYLDNTIEPLVASLCVPRNDKLVKIDGNLVIHSVLATEKAITSPNSNVKKANGGTGLAIARDHDSALAIPEVGRNGGRNPQTYGSTAGHLKALPTFSAESSYVQYKLSASTGTIHQWFLEGLAGPMLSTGMCTEVFRFDVSPTPPGAIIPVPAAAVTNVTTVHRQNSTNANNVGNRRTLRGPPVPISGLNNAEERVKMNPQESHQGKESVSSMVVSVLVDPREAGDSVADGMISTKSSLSRIFVVVLLDSVKYVTYSCRLPRSAPHLVKG